MLLAHAMDAGSGLLVIAHGIIQRVEDHGGCRRQRNAQACRGNLADEHPYRGIVLKGLNLGRTVGYAAMDYGIAKAFLFQQFLDSIFRFKNFFKRKNPANRRAACRTEMSSAEAYLPDS